MEEPFPLKARFRRQVLPALRTNALNAFQRRIESFVSASGATAARRADTVGGIVSCKVVTTLFFSDIKDFTGYAECNPPETVVSFLNRLMSLQVEILDNHGGDVDKMIGDAVLARFDSANGCERALRAAIERQTVAKEEGFPQPLGIGIFRGEVISGAIGPANRRDYTVIGDTVNIAARLCSAARAGEIVVESSLADGRFDPPEAIRLKGRREPLSVRRRKI